MIKLPFRYALSTFYAKFLIEDIILAAQSVASAGLLNLLVLIDPAIQWSNLIQLQSLAREEAKREAVSQLNKELFPDADTQRIIKEVCIDMNINEIKVFMWDRMNAGYVFKRIYLPINWKEFFTEEEMKAIIGHELGHLKLGADAMIPLRLVNKVGDEMLYSMIPAHATGYLILLTSLMTHNTMYLKTMSVTLLFRSLHFIIENYFSRKEEYKADQHGASVSSPKAMKKALQKIDTRARIEFLESLHTFQHAKQFYYHWLLKKDEGWFRELLLDHPFLHKRVKAI